MAGVLSGLKVVEMAGLGPAPFCAMLLADHGAEVIRIARPGQTSPLPLPPERDVLNRGRETLTLDLKTDPDRATLRALIAHADALIEGFRPGTMEKLGFGPEIAAALNPRLVYGRMTGWGQSGPLALRAGHDLNYAALSGAIAAIGDPSLPPPPPLNLVADFGGGAMFLAFGLLAAVLEAQRSGQDQVVDAAMVDGSALLMSLMHSMRAAGAWSLARGANLLDGGTPFYACYATSDGKYLAVCPLEPQFYAALLDRLDLKDDPAFARQYDPATWPAMRARLTTIFAARARADWEALFEGSDACVTPVLDMAEAPAHAHNAARKNFVDIAGISQSAPAPRFSRSAALPPAPITTTQASAEKILARWRANA
jgi:alpha-methylacyl-CoA racemase